MALPLRYNVAPTQSAPVVLHGVDEGGPVLRLLRWGLIPSWAKDPAIANSLVNARAEGLEAHRRSVAIRLNVRDE